MKRRSQTARRVNDQEAECRGERRARPSAKHALPFGAQTCCPEDPARSGQAKGTFRCAGVEKRRAQRLPRV